MENTSLKSSLPVTTNPQEFARLFKKRRIKSSCLCGSRKGLPIKIKDRYGIGIVPFFCTHCGHIYSRFRLTDQDIEAFYATTYRKLYRKGVHAETNDKVRQNIIARSKNSREVMLPLFKKWLGHVQNPLIIEWGSSAGWNLLPFHEEGIRACGFDLDHEHVEFGRKTLGLELMTPDNLKTQTEFKGKADFLIVNHVLEHIVDPMLLLKKLTALIKPDGYIFIGLPFLEHISDNGFHNYFHIAHLHYFSMPYFIDLVKRHGFTIVEKNNEKEYLLLQQNNQEKVGSKSWNRYNASLLIRHGIPYYLTVWPYKTIVSLIKKMPKLEAGLKKIKGRLSSF